LLRLAGPVIPKKAVQAARAVFLRERVDRSTAPWPSENAKLCEHCLADGDALGSVGRCRHVNVQCEG
jgi:hypothetical protein